MTKQDKLNKKFKVYYFDGDFFSSKGEKRRSVIVTASSEKDAEQFFKHSYSNHNFGWVEEMTHKYGKEKTHE